MHRNKVLSASLLALFALFASAGIAFGQDIVLTNPLSIGSTGDSVKALQSFLAGIPGIYPEGKITGTYGALTKKAVIAFQKSQGVNPTGTVGPKTLEKISNYSPALTSSEKPVLTSSISGDPVRLKIPAINVNAYVEQVGLLPSGQMDMTSSNSNVAWYKLGPKPGESGNAVIGGHYWGNKKSVFQHLDKLQTGDTIYVEDKNGQTKKFVVTGRKVYGASDSAPDVFIAGDAKSHLNIITCHGTWIPSRGTYDKRLVIFTDLAL